MRLFATSVLLAALTAPTTVHNPDYTSTNWSGYAFKGGPFNMAQGTFSVPAVTGTTSEGLSDWVGIDGYSNQDLIQAGVEETPTGDVAWWEILPDHEITLPLPVTVGDEVRVRIKRNVGTHWTITITNMTTHQGWNGRFVYGGPATSAEWINEAPTFGTTQTEPLVATSVTFRNIKVDGTGTLEGLVMYQHNHPCYSPTVETKTWLLDYGFTVSHV